MNQLKAIVSTALLLISGFTNSFGQTQTDKIQVAGNCGMCKKNIETAAKKAGASEAKWDKSAKVLTVTYDASKSSNDAIQKKVAAIGYDTEKYPGDEVAYKKLHECCQYDDKKHAAKN